MNTLGTKIAATAFSAATLVTPAAAEPILETCQPDKVRSAVTEAFTKSAENSENTFTGPNGETVVITLPENASANNFQLKEFESAQDFYMSTARTLGTSEAAGSYMVVEGEGVACTFSITGSP